MWIVENCLKALKRQEKNIHRGFHGIFGVSTEVLSKEKENEIPICGFHGKCGKLLFLRVDVGGDLLDHFREGGILLDEGSHLVTGVHDGGMVTAKLNTDIREGKVRHVIDQIHGDLSCLYDAGALCLAADDAFFNIEVAATLGDDRRGSGNKFIIALENILEGAIDGILIQILNTRSFDWHVVWMYLSVLH